MRLTHTSLLTLALACTAPGALAQATALPGASVYGQPAVETQAVPATIAQLSGGTQPEKEMWGGIDWQNNVVYAVGDGAPPADAVNVAQARVRAKRAAIDEAMARLLEQVLAVRVDAQSETRDFVNESRVVRNAVSGLVRNAQIVDIRQFPDGRVQVKMSMPLYGKNGLIAKVLPLAIARPPAVPPVSPKKDAPSQVVGAGGRPASEAQVAPPGSTASEQDQVASQKGTLAASEQAEAEPKVPPVSQEAYTALIIDATGVSTKPALFPRILGASGKVLYDIRKVDPNTAVEQGMCTYRKSVEEAKKSPLAGRHPMVIQALDAKGEGGVDLVVDDAEAARVEEALKQNDFLRQGRVIVVWAG